MRTALKPWWDPRDGKWHRGVEVWRRVFVIEVLLAAMYASALTVRHDWGNNPFTYVAVFAAIAALFGLAGWVRAYRRGWRRGGHGHREAR